MPPGQIGWDDWFKVSGTHQLSEEMTGMGGVGYLSYPPSYMRSPESDNSWSVFYPGDWVHFGNTVNAKNQRLSLVELRVVELRFTQKLRLLRS